MQKLISIIIPSYNEGNNVAALYEKIAKQFLGEQSYDYEIIYVNDGSSDNTSDEVEKLIVRDSRVRLIEFSRNFNKEIAMSAGYDYCNGDAAIVIDADLQHPVELISEMLRAWERGVEIVIGVRDGNLGASTVKKIGSYLFFHAMARMGDVRLAYGETDFRLLDRCVVVEFRKLKERMRTTRCLIGWLGFKKEYIHFVASKRNDGKSRYSIFKLCKLAISTLLMHSMAPLMFAGAIGLIAVLASIGVGVSMALLPSIYFIRLSAIVLDVVIIFLIGVVLACMGVFFFYFNALRKEVVGRPLYIVRRTRNV